VQHLVARSYEALSAVLGPGAARRLSRAHPAFEDEAAYQAWIDARESRSARLPAERPLVSLLMPVFDAPERFLRDAIGSLRAQSYAEWELCAVDAGPAGSAGSRALGELARADGRVRVLPVEANRGIAGNTNVALEAARGEFVASFDQDDLLAPDALAALVGLLDARPALDVLYSDMDNVTPWGERYAPFFKPDWSPELLLSANYLAHFSLIRRGLAARLRFDPSMDGAQDWDLLLRVTDATPRVGHVPEVLYHWRALPTSCASSLDAKPYAREAQRRAVQAALDRRGLAARAELVPDGTLRLIAREGRAHDDVLYFLDPRLRPEGDHFRDELALWASDPQVGAAGALFQAAGHEVESAGYVQSERATLSLFAGSGGRRWSPLGWPQWLRNVTAPVPLAFATRRDVYEKAGGHEAGIDGVLAFCRRLAEAGLRCVTVPTAVVRGPIEAAPPRVVDGGGTGIGFSPNLDPMSPVPRPR
jgi:glycosyltransferase involved in cell wall biosynthesis